MNERIKELEKQCWSHRVDGTLVDGPLHFDTQKFAELIVKECMSIVENYPIDPEDMPYNGRIIPYMIFVQEKMQLHFGVEE